MKHDTRTDFRQWFEDCLRGLKGKRVEWPQLLRHVLGERIQATASSGIFYKGEVFIDRDLRPGRNDPSRVSEPLLVKRWYQAIHQQGGVLRLDSEDVWPISWEVPNQGNEQSNEARGRRVDLLGLRRDGSLVVFECKVETNKDTPLFALLEGLDYLGCLLTGRNMEKLAKGFQHWRNKDRTAPGKVISCVPPGFQDVEIRGASGRHAVVVLAPSVYFKNHEFDSTSIPQDWKYLSDRFWGGKPIGSESLQVQLDFAVTDFSGLVCEWLSLPGIKP